ncbi:MAG: cytochrome P450 [Alphaproteobacteria bacterium]
MTKTVPVNDWSTDYDIFDPDYIRDPVPVWKELRGQCPVAHTDRHSGSWLPTRYEDLQAFVRMVPEMSSKEPIVVPPPIVAEGDVDEYGIESPPITSDPPEQIPIRRLILPFFTAKAVAPYREGTVELCHSLINEFIDKGEADAAVQYAQQLPPRIIARMLGVDPGRADDFVEWVRGLLEIGLTNPESRVKYRRIIREFFAKMVADRRKNPGDDMISQLLEKELDGEPVTDRTAVGMCNLMLVAGIDTTWSSIGSALWHLASTPSDRQRLASEPELFPSAVEELLRYYSPVTMARICQKDIDVAGVSMKAGDRVLMNFPGANHDPEVFDNPDEVILDREKNRHIAFGVGIHRCAGSNLARMEMDVALRVWMERIPEFELSDPDTVKWAGGQVRGPRNIPVQF